MHPTHRHLLMADEVLPELVEGCQIRTDLGFLNYRSKGTKTAIPHKKPKGKRPTAAEGKGKSVRGECHRTHQDHAHRQGQEP